jgi:hypothetical protein
MNKISSFKRKIIFKLNSKKKHERLNDIFFHVHNQDLIDDCENKNKNIKECKYLFLGNQPVFKYLNNEKVLVARSFKKNIENLIFFTAFTGWYCLWKNNLIKSKYITLLEYDVSLSCTFEEKLENQIHQESKIIAFLPLSTRDLNFIENDNWVKEILFAIKKVYCIDLKSLIHTLSRNNEGLVWSSTSNTCFRYDVFIDYMLWFEPLIPYLKNSKYSGHAFERSISFYSLIHHIEICYVENILEHHNLDSHLTQGTN